jgi:hypothetical protein
MTLFAASMALATLAFFQNCSSGFKSQASISSLFAGFSTSSDLNETSAFAAAGSLQTTKGTIAKGSNQLNVGSAIDFSPPNANGFAQGIRINGAGSSIGIGAPTPIGGIAHGLTGATNYTYLIEALDPSGGVKAAVPIVMNNGNSTLGANNYNSISWTAASGSPYAYAIFVKCTGCSQYNVTPQLIAIASATTFDDFGSTAISGPDWLSASILVTDQADWLVTTVQSIVNGTQLVLAKSASNAVTSSVSNNVFHDDTAAIQTAINAAQANHSRVHLSGTVGQLFPISSTLNVTSHIEIFGDGVANTGTLCLTACQNLHASDLANSTNIVPAASSTGISVITADAVEIDHFGIVYLTPAARQSNVAGLYISGVDQAHYCLGDNVHDMLFAQADVNTLIQNCVSWHVQDSVYYNFVTNGIETGIGTGWNDWWITNNSLMDGPATTSNSAFIHIISSAAVNISGNKINSVMGGITNVSGILINPIVNGSSVEPVRITDNSIEGNLTGINFYNSCPGGNEGSLPPGYPLTLGIVGKGSGGTDGTYTNVPLVNVPAVGGNGTGALATVTVSGGIVTTIVVTNNGSGYLLGDQLTVSSSLIGGVANFLGQVGVLPPFGLLVGGSNGTDGVYTNVALTGPSGSGALATVFVNGGAVVAVFPSMYGFGYNIGETLQANPADIGGVIGFSAPVNSVSNMCSGSQVSITGNQIWATTDISFFDGKQSMFIGSGTVSGNSLMIVGGADATYYNVILGTRSVNSFIFGDNVIGNTSGAGAVSFYNDSNLNIQTNNNLLDANDHQQ